MGRRYSAFSLTLNAEIDYLLRYSRPPNLQQSPFPIYFISENLFTMVNAVKAMEVDDVNRKVRHQKGVLDKSKKTGKKKKEAKMMLRKEKKMLAKAVRNKKMKKEFSNHKPYKCKNTDEKLAKNYY